MGDQIKRNFENLNFIRENKIFTEILLKDFERKKELERIKLAAKTGVSLDLEEEIDSEEKPNKNNILLNKHLFF